MPSHARQPSSTTVATASCAFPLPEPGWGTTEALAALEAARPALCGDIAGPDAGDPPVEVLGRLTTVVLGVGTHVVKIYPPGTDAGHLDLVSRALHGSRSATVTTSPAVPTAYGVVTLARRLPGGAPATWPEVGETLRHFHLEHQGAAVPEWAPLSRMPSQLSTLAAEHAEVLRAAGDELLAALSGVRSELGHGVIHGDVSPSNVMRDGPQVTLIDLDWVARAPREYDLASASRRFRAGEIDRQTYRGFCRAYGHDVLGWDGLPLIDRIADLAGVVFRLWDCRHHGRDLGWLPDELRLWRTAV